MIQVLCKTAEIRQSTFVLGKEDKYNNPVPEKVYNHSMLDPFQPFISAQRPSLPPSLKISIQSYVNQCQSLPLNESPLSLFIPLHT